MAFLTGIFTKLVGLVVSLALFFTLPPPCGQSFTQQSGETLRLQLSVLSDVHTESYTYHRFRTFAAVLRDIARAQTPSDALVLLGDNTMNGQPTEYIMLYSLLSRYNRAKDLIVAMGNHDMNRGSYTPEDAIARHNLFYQSYTGRANDKPYYSVELKGYHMIVLGDELPLEDTRATISQAQLDWLAAEMALAGASGKPIFVFCHQPLNHTFPRWGWGGLGEQSEAVRAILTQYENVFFFSGHLHTEPLVLTYNGNGDGVTYVNLPASTALDSNDGVGFQVEVYDSGVQLRLRNFRTGQWLETMYMRIEID